MIDVEKFLKDNAPAGILDKRCLVYDVVLSPDGDGWVLGGWVSIDRQKNKLEENLRELVGDAPIKNDIKLLPDENLKEHFALANKERTGIWAEPKEGAELVNEVLYGHGLRLMRDDGKFYRCLGREGYVGYVRKSDVWPCSFEEFKRIFHPRQVIFHDNVALNGVQISRGTQLPLTSNREVQLLDGAVPLPDDADFTLLDENRRLEWLNRTVKIAKNYLNVPYLWGGGSTHGVDCSGFVQAIHRQMGLELARDAGQQYLPGVLVAYRGESLDHVQPGDLVFFLGKGVPRITHIGMSLGGYKFIHASGDGIVKINSMHPDDQEYHPRSAEAMFAVKRIIFA